MGLRDWFRSKPAQTKAARTPVPSLRFYPAGNIDRLTASWSASEVSVDDVIRRDLRVVRARAREQYRANDYVSRFVQLVRSNVVGPQGVVVQATVHDAPEFGGGLDVAVNDTLEATFANWGRAETCDAAGRLSWRQFQSMVVASVAIDGEAIVVMHRSAKNRFKFSLQLVDPVTLDIELHQDVPGKPRIKFGVEIDQFGRAVAYYFKQADRSMVSAFVNGKGYSRIIAADVLHLFVQEYVGQVRGFPWVSTPLSRLNMLAGYEDAAVTAARVGAAKMGFFTSADGAGYTGDAYDADGAVITDAQPGTFEQLPAGVSFQSFDPDYPHQQFGEFVKACLRGISSGLGVSYASLSGDLEGVNYSSIRAGVLEDRESWKALQTWFVESFVQPVYEAWVRSLVLASLPILPGGGRLRDADVDRYLAASYQPRRWAWVDPQKDTQANIDAVNAGLKSRGEVIREQGRDPDDVWRELAAEAERLAELGITISAPSAPAPGGDSNVQ